MKKVKQYLRFIVFAAFMFYWGMQTYEFYRLVSNDTKQTRCGTVTFKGNDTQVNKHSSETEFILVIEYDDKHRKEDEEVSASIWSSYNVGDRICLSSSVMIGEKMGFVDTILGLAGCAVIVIIGVVVIGYLIAWFFFDTPIFTKKWWTSTTDNSGAK